MWSRLVAALTLSTINVVVAETVTTTWSDYAESQQGEDVAYQAETSRLMNIIVNSLYTDREVFLRELISNSADALEKSRIIKLAEHDWQTPLQINVTADVDRHVLTITDNGIGMCREELKRNLGTLAKSGTHEFLDATRRGESGSNLIGQFGVGFYSVFLVGEKVLVKSKCANETNPNVWISNDGGSQFRVVTLEPEEYESGTSIEIRLKNDAHEFAEPKTLRDLLARFSQFLPFPIYMQTDPTFDWEHVNVNKPLWLRDRDEITEEEYNEFYRAISKEHTNPLGHTHFRTDGDYEFTGLMYIPERPSRKYYDNNLEDRTQPSQIKMYVQRVLVSDTLKSFLPTWLNFVTGVLDSNHLPLKVDRETFTNRKVMERMKQKVISKVFDLMKSIVNGGDCNTIGGTCFRMSKTYGKNLMMGCVEDRSPKNTKRILDVSLFRTNLDGLHQLRLDEYIEMMKPGQKSIFYIGGDNYNASYDSGFLEEFNKNEVPVLILSGPYESGCLMGLDYKDIPIKSIETDTIDAEELAFLKADGNTSRVAEIVKAEVIRGKKIDRLYKPLIDYCLENLHRTSVSKVVMSSRLGKAPAIISVPEFGLTASHERLINSQLGSTSGFYGHSKTLELNPNHPIIYNLLKEVEAGTSSPDILKNRLKVIYQAALISAGFQPSQPKILLNDLFSSLLHKSFNDDSDELAAKVEQFELEIPDYPDLDVVEDTNEESEDDGGENNSFDGRDEL